MSQRREGNPPVDLRAHRLYRYLYYRVGSHALAEDLTSETFPVAAVPSVAEAPAPTVEPLAAPVLPCVAVPPAISC